MGRGGKPTGCVLGLTISTFSLVRLLSFSSILWMLCSRSSFFLFIRLFFSTSGFSCTSVSRERFSCSGYRYRSGDWMDPRVGQATPAELQHCPFRSLTPGGQSSHLVFPGHSLADGRTTPCRQQPWPEPGHLLSTKGVQSYSLEGLTTISKQTDPKKVRCPSRLSFIQPLGTTLMPLLAL